jgi:hypothetical protein
MASTDVDLYDKETSKVEAQANLAQPVPLYDLAFLLEIVLHESQTYDQWPV